VRMFADLHLHYLPPTLVPHWDLRPPFPEDLALTLEYDESPGIGPDRCWNHCPRHCRLRLLARHRWPSHCQCPLGRHSRAHSVAFLHRRCRLSYPPGWNRLDCPKNLALHLVSALSSSFVAAAVEHEAVAQNLPSTPRRSWASFWALHWKKPEPLQYVDWISMVIASRHLCLDLGLLIH